jgi:ribosomal protein S19
MKAKLISENFKYLKTRLKTSKLILSHKKNQHIDIHTYQRGTLITPNCVGKRCAVYNGSRFQSFLISKEMIGFKFGSFVQTKKTGQIIHVKKPGKKKKGGAKQTN